VRPGRLDQSRQGAIWRDLNAAYFGDKAPDNPFVTKKLTELKGEPVFFFATQEGEMRPACPVTHQKTPVAHSGPFVRAGSCERTTARTLFANTTRSASHTGRSSGDYHSRQRPRIPAEPSCSIARGGAPVYITARGTKRTGEAVWTVAGF
jgi:Tfp pilus assembly protein PilX